MLRKRIIPCLDVRDGKVVKGVQFRNHKILGDILPLADHYRKENADELVFYDITASTVGQTVDKSWITQVARILDIPFCVAGGIKSVDDGRRLLEAGADKISINSKALERPQLIDDLVKSIGQQSVVVGVDSMTTPDGKWEVYQYTGSEKTICRAGRETLSWLREIESRGAGEVVLNCINQDGMGAGYDIRQLKQARELLTIPLIASGGAGTTQHFIEVFREADVDGALAAGVFHRGEISLRTLKQNLHQAGIPVRLPSKEDFQ